MAEPAPAAGGVFLSYRREDTAYSAGWLFDRLSEHLGQDRVFKDVDSIELGQNFAEVIMTAIGSCDVLLALIGDRWLDIADASGTRRLDNPDDFVRLEIEAALARGIRVIPILVDGAELPRSEDLPPSLAELVRFQGLELSPVRFNADTNRLLEVLQPALTDGPTPAPAGSRRRRKAAGSLAPTPASASAQRELPAWRRLGSSRPARKLPILGAAAAVLVLLVVVVVRSVGPDSSRVEQGAAVGTGSDGSPSSTVAPPSTESSVTSSVAPPTTAAPVSSSVVPPSSQGPVRPSVVPRTTARPTSSVTSVQRSSGAIFGDDFSTAAAGWQPSARTTGGHVGGAYEVRVGPIAEGGGGASYPLKATGVYPSAPPSIRMEATAHRIATTGQSSTMALVCRSTGGSFYAFVMGRTHLAIEKYSDRAPYYRELKDVPLPVDPNAPTRLQAVCRTDGARQYLGFSVNNRLMLEVSDGESPLTTGTVGIGAFVGSAADSIVARFDDFAVSPG